MKHLIIITIFSILSKPVFAHPGSSTLVCKSVDKLGSKTMLEVLVKRDNGIGWGSPTVEIKVNGKLTTLSTPDDMNNYGETFHNSPLKVIRVTVVAPDADELNTGIFSVVAIPETVKAFDKAGKPVKWSLKAENDECYDVQGKAVFKGIIHGFIHHDDLQTQLDSQVLDCTLTYNPGMSC